jgi:hypothetical protein
MKRLELAPTPARALVVLWEALVKPRPGWRSFCGSEMRVLAFITDFATARAICRSLKLPDQAPEPLAHGPPHELELLAQIA